MKGSFFSFLLVLLQSFAAQAVEVVDDRGFSTILPHPPQRIVSLLPSLTESICELGYCQRLVGVDRYSNFPASLQNLPQLGGGLDPNIEAIVALKPDVVVMAASSRAGERLRALGLNVVALEPKTHADVQRVLRKLGQLLEAPDVDKIWRAIDAGVSAAAQSLPLSARGTRRASGLSRGCADKTVKKVGRLYWTCTSRERLTRIGRALTGAEMKRAIKPS